MDWADEVAEKLCLDESGDHPRLPGMDEIATALRKAKADGMRQAISIIRIHDGYSAPLVEAFEKAEAVAAEIEKGNP